MTPNPKEKAKELVLSFIHVDEDDYRDSGRAWIDKILAKQCALIHVNQILKLPVCWYSKEMADRDNEAYPYEGTKEHWEQLKAEIENYDTNRSTN